MINLEAETEMFAFPKQSAGTCCNTSALLTVFQNVRGCWAHRLIVTRVLQHRDKDRKGNFPQGWPQLGFPVCSVTWSGLSQWGQAVSHFKFSRQFINVNLITLNVGSFTGFTGTGSYQCLIWFTWIAKYKLKDGQSCICECVSVRNSIIFHQPLNIHQKLADNNHWMYIYS